MYLIAPLVGGERALGAHVIEAGIGLFQLLQDLREAVEHEPDDLPLFVALLDAFRFEVRFHPWADLEWSDANGFVARNGAVVVVRKHPRGGMVIIAQRQQFMISAIDLIEPALQSLLIDAIAPRHPVLA